MNVELTPGQRALIAQAIESGRLTREEQAIEEAMALWEHRERRRLEIDAMVEDVKTSLAQNEGGFPGA